MEGYNTDSGPVRTSFPSYVALDHTDIKECPWSSNLFLRLISDSYRIILSDSIPNYI